MIDVLSHKLYIYISSIGFNGTVRSAGSAVGFHRHGDTADTLVGWI